MIREKQRVTQGDRHSKNWIRQIPDIVWAPFVAGLLILIVGLLGLAFGQPWLFPSLGPTAFLQAEQPKQPTARFYNVVVGHLHGLAAGLLAVVLLGATTAPPVLSTGELTAVRVWASVLAMFLNMLFGFLLKAPHPPAAATTLLFSLGGFKPTAADAIHVVIGAIAIAVAGELLRQIRLKAKLSEA
ncbi:HPP family protein [Leptolyngbya ohadii]|uniref:HPP family protein n=1 Tax=Leptolyngbya ohadii TaxID=1962290 RepID=UPI000B59BF75|nr:HPP family protein [Leptolyngbya ohadii]